MVEQFSDRAESTLAAGISAGATSLTVPSGHGARFPTTGDFSILLQDASVATTYELVKATARSGDTLTITPTANAWDAGDKVVQVLDKRAMEAIRDSIPAAGAMALIAESVLGSAAASIEFASIPATYRHLMLMLQARGDAAATNAAVKMRFNSDTGSNYDWRETSTTGDPGSTAVGSGLATTSIEVGWITSSTGPASAADGYEIVIPNYRGTTFQKVAKCAGGTKNGTGSVQSLYVYETRGWWRNTSAITTVTLLPASGNFDTGTVATLYGLAAA